MNEIIRHRTAVPATQSTGGAVAAVQALGSPAYDARRVLGRCRIARLPSFFRSTKDNLPAARKLVAAGIPPSTEVISAILELDEADSVSLDGRTSRLISAVILDALGRNAKENAETLIEALSLVASDDTYDDDVIGVVPIRPSALVAALATLRIIKTHKFLPTAAELRAAMYDVRIKLHDLREHLQKARIVVDAIEETIDDYGRPQELLSSPQRLLPSPDALEWD